MFFRKHPSIGENWSYVRNVDYNRGGLYILEVMSKKMWVGVFLYNISIGITMCTMER